MTDCQPARISESVPSRLSITTVRELLGALNRLIAQQAVQDEPLTVAQARKVLAKIIEEEGVDDLLLTLADCLREHLRHGINEDVVREQVNLYAES